MWRIFEALKILLHAVDAAGHGATEINIHSTDTNVFILSLRRYPQLGHETNFITETGQRHGVIKLQPIVHPHGTHNIAALSARHALSGADNTGSFAGKGKATSWKAFQEASQDIITAFANLGASEPPLICKLYVPNTTITTVKDLRWWLFKKEAGSIRETSTNTSCHRANCNESLLSSNVLE